jgi:hypothetical protein
MEIHGEKFYSQQTVCCKSYASFTETAAVADQDLNKESASRFAV